MSHARPGRKSQGRDYTYAVIDILPDIISRTPMTISEIAKEIGRSKQTVHTCINKNRSKVHIAGWGSSINGGDKGPKYLWGPGKDVEKPRPLTKAEKNERYMNTERGREVRKAYLQAWRNSEHGKEWAKAWRNSERGKEYIQAYTKAYSARKKFQKHGVKAIDPLLAAIMGA